MNSMSILYYAIVLSVLVTFVCSENSKNSDEVIVTVSPVEETTASLKILKSTANFVESTWNIEDNDSSTTNENLSINFGSSDNESLFHNATENADDTTTTSFESSLNSQIINVDETVSGTPLSEYYNDSASENQTDSTKNTDFDISTTTPIGTSGTTFNTFDYTDDNFLATENQTELTKHTHFGITTITPIGTNGTTVNTFDYTDDNFLATENQTESLENNDSYRSSTTPIGTSLGTSGTTFNTLDYTDDNFLATENQADSTEIINFYRSSTTPIGTSGTTFNTFDYKDDDFLAAENQTDSLENIDFHATSVASISTTDNYSKKTDDNVSTMENQRESMKILGRFATIPPTYTYSSTFETNDPLVTSTDEIVKYLNSKNNITDDDINQIKLSSKEYKNLLGDAIANEFTNEIPSESTSSSIDNTILTTESGLCGVKNFFISKIYNEKTEIAAKWATKSVDSVSNCFFNISSECKSLNTSLDWIVPFQSTEVEVIDEEPIVTVGNLSEFTTYNCTSRLKNLNNGFEISTSFIRTTFSEVPSDINFTITDITPTNFTINWKKPYKIPGNLKMYYILIENVGPKHFIREECQTLSIGFTITFYSEKESFKHNITNNVEPNFEYNVQILAEDEAGNSTGIEKKITTKSSSSTKPLNVTADVLLFGDRCDGEEYNATILIKWELPCNTNGELKEFRVDITGNAFIQKSIVPTGWSELWEVPRNDNISDIFYQLYVSNLNASNIYNFTITPISEDDLHGESAKTFKQTPHGCPDAPNAIMISNVTTSSFSILWDFPQEYYGNILGYVVEVQNFAPTHFVSRENQCPHLFPIKYEFTTNTTFLEFKQGYPNFQYSIRLKAKTPAGFGRYSKYFYVTTMEKEPDPVMDINILNTRNSISREEYKYRIRLKFKTPCNTNGPFHSYTIKGRGRREGYKDDDSVFINITHPYITSFDINLLKPEYNYTFEIQVHTKNHKSKIMTKSIMTSAGIPPLNLDGFKCSINEENPTQIDVVLNKNISDDNNGKVLYYSVILMKSLDQNIADNNSFGFWNGYSWPSPNLNFIAQRDRNDIIQLTKDFWNPFKDGKEEVHLPIGRKESCNTDNNCPNLETGTNYVIVLRSLTNTSYSEVYTLVKTGSSSNSFGLGILLIILFLIVLGVIAFLIVKKRNLWKFRNVTEVIIIADKVPRYNVSVQHFVSYYNKVINDPTLLKNQFDDIEDEIQIYKQDCVNTTFATKPENKRKNRYTNILPYDESRVRLNIEEDDEMSSDYINASYIKGFSGEVEYIATQGPLEHTCKDFWKMVVQENVTVIVMVSLFVEKEKEKCFKYFPNNHETMLISEDIEVKCLTELQFETHCTRTLLVRKDNIQQSVIHIQYLEWPDFGCPKGTSDMLSFCQEIRDRIQLEKGLMIVHCSAGVGRTGTLISLDILLQEIKRKREISIFETVIDLRKQRTHMVQTEKQYVFIHTCIKDALKKKLYLTDDSKKDDEHTYENTRFYSGSGSPRKISKGKQYESAF